MNSFVEGIEGVPLFSNLHLFEQPPEDSAQTSKLKIVLLQRGLYQWPKTELLCC